MDWFLLLIIGFVAGTSGSLLGIGGGFIIIPLLMYFHPELSALQISALSLACVFVNALASVVLNYKCRRIDIKTAFLFSLSSIPGTLLATIFVTKVPLNVFRIFLGLLFIIAAIMLFGNTFKVSNANPSKAKEGAIQRKITDAFGMQYHYAFHPGIGILASFFIGIVSTLFGIGGGIFYMPLFVHVLGIPVQIATATSQFGLLLTSCVGTGMYLLQGLLTATVYLLWPLTLGILSGVLFAFKYLNNIKPVTIIRLFTLVVLFTGFRMLWTAVW